MDQVEERLVWSGVETDRIGISTHVPTHPRDRSPYLYRYGRGKDVCHDACTRGCVGTGILIAVVSVATPNHWRE